MQLYPKNRPARSCPPGRFYYVRLDRKVCRGSWQAAYGLLNLHVLPAQQHLVSLPSSHERPAYLVDRVVP